MATSISKAQGKASKKVSNAPTVSSEERYRMIAEAAYYRSEHRRSQGGDTVSDWLTAEAEIDKRLLAKRQ
jgi:hypothetical protein